MRAVLDMRESDKVFSRLPYWWMVSTSAVISSKLRFRPNSF